MCARERHCCPSSLENFDDLELKERKNEKIYARGRVAFCIYEAYKTKERIMRVMIGCAPPHYTYFLFLFFAHTTSTSTYKNLKQTKKFFYKERSLCTLKRKLYASVLRAKFAFFFSLNREGMSLGEKPKVSQGQRVVSAKGVI
jgi:hypothetical protein